MGRWVNPFDENDMTSDEFDEFVEKFSRENPGEKMTEHEWATDEDLFDHEPEEIHVVLDEEDHRRRFDFLSFT